MRSIGGEGIGRKSIAVLLRMRPAGGVRLQVGLEEVKAIKFGDLLMRVDRDLEKT